MAPSLTLFLAAIVFGAGFGLGNAIITGLLGLIRR
jgi:hypothetical protein